MINSSAKGVKSHRSPFFLQLARCSLLPELWSWERQDGHKQNARMTANRRSRKTSNVTGTRQTDLAGMVFGLRTCRHAPKIGLANRTKTTSCAGGVVHPLRGPTLSSEICTIKLSRYSRSCWSAHRSKGEAISWRAIGTSKKSEPK